jgi:hypothetical protein
MNGAMTGYSRLFRSRWAALLWAAGICWTAYDVAAPDPAPTEANSAQSDDADVAALRSAINQM